MFDSKLKTRALIVLLSLVPWILCGCTGGKIVSLTSLATTNAPASGESGNSAFSGGVGVSPSTGAAQGVATDSNGNFYVSSNSWLAAYDPNWNQIWRNSNALAGLAPTVTHIGDIAYYSGYLYAPVEAYNGCSSFQPTLLAVYDAATGKLVTWSDISADGHEVSSVTVVPVTNQLVVSSFCDANNGFATLWNYDLNALLINQVGGSLSYSSTTALSNPIPRIQGISWNDDANQFAISTDINGLAGGVWFASAAGIVTGPVYIMPSGVSAELEGVDYTTGYIYLLENGFVYGIGAPVAPPSFSVVPGTYQTAQTITMSDETSGATIYYTSDGTMPITSSMVYRGPITISSSQTLKAIAAVTGSANSPMATAAYVITK